MRLFLLVLVGCGGKAGVIELGEPGTVESEDSGQVTGDTGTPVPDPDPDPEPDPEPEPEPDPEPEPEPDFTYWKGERLIMRDGCKETISEVGERLTRDWEYYDAAKDLCPECEHFYYISLSPTEACDVEFAPEGVRSFSLDSNGDAEVLVWSQQDYDYVPLAEDGALEGQALSYEYDFEYDRDDVEVEGTVIFDGTWE